MRAGETARVSDRDFDNPLIPGDFSSTTGGTHGRPRRILIDLDYLADMAPGWAVWFAAHDWLARPLVFVTPTYHVIRLYNEHLGRDRLAARVSSPTFDSSAEGTRVPVLDVVASRSADGRRLFVKAVNTGRDRALQTEVAITGATVGADGTAHTLTADSLEAANSFRTPDAVAVRTASVRSGPKFTLELPPHSVTVLTVPLAGAGTSKQSSSGR